VRLVLPPLERLHVTALPHRGLNKNGNALEVMVSPEFVSIYADEMKVRQSLLNLLSNACKFTKNGTVTLDVHPEQIDNVRSVLFSVTDTGIGMTPEQMCASSASSRRPIRRRRAIRRHGPRSRHQPHVLPPYGGDIQVASELGKGSTFRMVLPQARR